MEQLETPAQGGEFCLRFPNRGGGRPGKEPIANALMTECEALAAHDDVFALTTENQAERTLLRELGRFGRFVLEILEIALEALHGFVDQLGVARSARLVILGGDG